MISNRHRFKKNKIYEFDKWTGDELFNRVSVVFKKGVYFLPKDLAKVIIAFYNRKGMDPVEREQFFNGGLKLQPIK